MSSNRLPFLRYFLFLNFTLLGGCSQTPFIKAPVNLYHDLEGGIVSQPRLPVPGNDQKYPYVGLTPKAPPPLPSPELRRSITDSLSHDRNLSEWEDIRSPLTIPKVPPLSNQPVINQPPPTKPTNTQSSTPQPINDQSSSASFDAAGESSPSLKQPIPNTPKTKPSLEPVVMPALRTTVDNKDIIIPEIPVNPPAPSNFPGFNIPTDINLPPPTHPSNLPLETPTGELIRFPIDSDVPYPKQDSTINNLAWHRNGGTLFIHGYGDTTSMDSDTQTKALALALLRAKMVAKMLISHNVPESAIVIRAHAFGHGVRVRMDD